MEKCRRLMRVVVRQPEIHLPKQGKTMAYGGAALTLALDGHGWEVGRSPGVQKAL